MLGCLFVVLFVSCLFLIPFFSVFYYLAILSALIHFLVLSPFYAYCASYFVSFVADELSFYACLISLVVFLLITLSFPSSKHLNLFIFLCMSMLFLCLVVFFTTNLLVLYSAYELSLLPIILIILFWGHYPERSTSAILLFGYTSVFSVPFIYVLWVLFCSVFSHRFFYFSYTGVLLPF